ncbi:MAG: hypothetical protein NWF07_07665 [Candidatus Bathyarchaeota archaeon]|nr:hypothetical protein [Candidatus Bathyarchaeota archaeon]
MKTTKTIPITQLADALRNLPIAIQASTDKTLNLTKAHQLAKTLCPTKTGALRETIRVIRPSNTEANLTAGTPTVTYAKPVHDGTSKQPARPFLHQALHAETHNITQAIIQDSVTRL